jgi:hypothetical protein
MVYNLATTCFHQTNAAGMLATSFADNGAHQTNYELHGIYPTDFLVYFDAPHWPDLAHEARQRVSILESTGDEDHRVGDKMQEPR